MNRMRMSVSNLAAVACCLLAAGASAQPLPPAAGAAGTAGQPGTAGPAGAAGRLQVAEPPSEFEWTGLDAIWNDAMEVGRPAASWGWPFQNASQTASRGAAQTESMEMAFSNPGSIGTVELHLFNGSVTREGHQPQGRVHPRHASGRRQRVRAQCPAAAGGHAPAVGAAAAACRWRRTTTGSRSAPGRSTARWIWRSRCRCAPTSSCGSSTAATSPLKAWKATSR